MHRWVASTTLVLIGILASPTAISAQDAALAASIHEGRCNDLGVEVASLTSVDIAGTPVGSELALPASSSFSIVPIGLDGLLANEHAIVIPDGESGVASCGEVGGNVSADGSLVMGLRPEAQSGVTGIAYLSANEDPRQVNISLFVAGESLEDLREIEPDTAPVVESSQSVDTADPSVDVNSETTQAYLADVIQITRTMTTSFDEFAALSANPQFGDDTWTWSLGTQFAIWRVSYDEASQLVPPPGFEEAHSVFLEGMRLYSEASYDAANGIDTFNVDLINQASIKLTQGNDLIAQATALFDALAP